MDDLNSDASAGVVLVTAGYDHTIKFWNPATGQCIHSVQHPESQVNGLAITPEGYQVAAAGYQHIRLYDLSGGGNPVPVINYEGIVKNVTAVQFDHSGHWMFTGGEDCSARMWDVRTKSINCSKIFQVNTTVNSVCLHPNQVELAIGDSNGVLYIWDMRNDQNEQYPLDDPFSSSIQFVDIDPEGTMAAAVTNKGMVYVGSLAGSGIEAGTDASGACRMSTLVPKMKYPAHQKYALKCRFSPDSTLLATTSADQTCRLWRTADLSETTVLRGAGEEAMRWVWDCAFTADSRHLFTCSSDGLLRLWHVDSGRLMRRYEGHQKPITAMAFRDVPLPT